MLCREDCGSIVCVQKFISASGFASSLNVRDQLARLREERHSTATDRKVQLADHLPLVLKIYSHVIMALVIMTLLFLLQPRLDTHDLNSFAAFKDLKSIKNFLRPCARIRSSKHVCELLPALLGNWDLVIVRHLFNLVFHP